MSDATGATHPAPEPRCPTCGATQARPEGAAGALESLPVRALAVTLCDIATTAEPRERRLERIRAELLRAAPTGTGEQGPDKRRGEHAPGDVGGTGAGALERARQAEPSFCFRLTPDQQERVIAAALAPPARPGAEGADAAS